MGCLISTQSNEHSPPLSTRAIYNLIFQKDDWIINKERSSSDYSISYRIDISPELSEIKRSNSS